MIQPNPDLPITFQGGALPRPIGAIVFYDSLQDAEEDARRLANERGFRSRERAAFEDVAPLLHELAAECGEEIAVLDTATGRVRKSKAIEGCATFSRECFVVGYR